MPDKLAKSKYNFTLKKVKFLECGLKPPKQHCLELFEQHFHAHFLSDYRV